MKILGSGKFRTAWLFREYDNKKRVLKTANYDKEADFSENYIDKQRRDAVAMEQLSASPHVADIYGCCSAAALVDYADGGDLRKFIKSNHTKSEFLKVAYQVPAAVADTHHVSAIAACERILIREMITRLTPLSKCRLMQTAERRLLISTLSPNSSYLLMGFTSSTTTIRLHS